MGLPRSIFREMEVAFDAAVKEHLEPSFVPTGLQEDIIRVVGCADSVITVIYDSSSNKIGKTAAAANILKNIALVNDKEYFDYPNFNNWPFPKQGRIIGTHTNVEESGALQKEIDKWIPAKKIEKDKGGKPYISQYRAGMWSWDVMTYSQEPEEFEGPLLGLIICDEPPPAKIIGSLMSRLSKGGVLLITATPWGKNVGSFLDVLDDLEGNGTKVVRLFGNIYENDMETGKANIKGTKRGLMTRREIDAWVAGIPLDEKQARVEGKPNYKSGKIYKEFDMNFHVKAFDMQWVLQNGNCYQSIDPHTKNYWYSSWWAILPGPWYVCYNEWPTYHLLNAFYDEIRSRVVNPYTLEQMVGYFKIMDGEQFGAKVVKRFIDPFFAAGIGSSDYAKATQGILLELEGAGLKGVELPPRENIAVQQQNIRELMSFDTGRPVNKFNEPSFYVLPHCRNMIRALERHYWDDAKEKESETYKDPCDTARNFFAGIGGRASYRLPSRVGDKKKIEEVLDIPKEMTSCILETSLS